MSFSRFLSYLHQQHQQQQNKNNVTGVSGTRIGWQFMSYRAFHDKISPHSPHWYIFSSMQKLYKHHFPVKWICLSCHHTRTVSVSFNLCFPNDDCCAVRAFSIDGKSEITFDLTLHYTTNFIFTSNDAGTINFLDDQLTVLLRNSIPPSILPRVCDS